MYYIGMGGRRPSSPLYIGMGGDRSRCTACVNIWTRANSFSQNPWNTGCSPVGAETPQPHATKGLFFLLTMHVTSWGRQIISGSNKNIRIIALEITQQPLQLRVETNMRFLQIPNVWITLHMSQLDRIVKPRANEKHTIKIR